MEKEQRRAQRQARRQARDEARAKRQYERLRSHVVNCPECGAEALDHMTECPKCGAALTPSGYKPMNEKAKKMLRAVAFAAGAVIVVAAVVIFMFC